MRKLLNIFAIIALCLFAYNRITKHLNRVGAYNVSEAYRNFDGMFGVCLGDMVDSNLSRCGEFEGMDVYMIRPPNPEHAFDRYFVLARPNQNRILLIRAEKDFSLKQELHVFIESLKGEFEKRFRTTARKMDQSDSWAFVFLGPRNGYDKGLTLVSGYDDSSRKWQVQLNAIDGNVSAKH